MSLYNKFQHAAKKALIAGALLTSANAAAHSPSQTNYVENQSKQISYITQESIMKKIALYNESSTQESINGSIKEDYSFVRTEQKLNNGYKVESTTIKKMSFDTQAKSKIISNKSNQTHTKPGSISRTANLIRPDGSKLNLDFLDNILSDMRPENLGDENLYKVKKNGQIKPVQTSEKKIKTNNAKAIAKIMAESIRHGISGNDLSAVMEFAHSHKNISDEKSPVLISSYKSLQSSNLTKTGGR